MDPGSDFDNIRSSAAPTGVSLGTDAGEGSGVLRYDPGSRYEPDLRRGETRWGDEAHRHVPEERTLAVRGRHRPARPVGS